MAEIGHQETVGLADTDTGKSSGCESPDLAKTGIPEPDSLALDNQLVSCSLAV